VTSKKQLILIPFWIQEILGRNKLPLSTCLELDKIKPIISLNDVSAFYALQGYFKHVIGIDVFPSLFSCWCDSITEQNVDVLKYRDTVSLLSTDTTINKDMYNRLFDPSSKSSQYDEPFKVYDLTPEIAGVVIYPGYFLEQTDCVQQKNLIEAILKVLYVYDAYHDVACTPSFKRYLELLSNK